MADQSAYPLETDAATAEKLLAAGNREYRGAGGIAVTMSPNRRTVTITLRNRNLAGGDSDGCSIYRVNKLIPLTSSDGFVLYKCRLANPDGTFGASDTPIWTRPDVSINDFILGIPVATGLSYSETIAGKKVTTKVVIAQPGADQPGPFYCKVEKTAGSDSTSAATTVAYTYTVRLITWTGSGTSTDYELGTVVAVVKPRESGSRTPQSSSAGYGIAGYIGGDLVLWDAGEIIGGGACTS